MKKFLFITGIVFLMAQQANAILITTTDLPSSGKSPNSTPLLQFLYGSDTLAKGQQLKDSERPYDGLFAISDSRASKHNPWLENFSGGGDIQWDGLANALGTQSADSLNHAPSNQVSPAAGAGNNGSLPEKKEYRSRISIPEPSSLGLMLLGAVGIVVIRRKSREIQ